MAIFNPTTDIFSRAASKSKRYDVFDSNEAAPEPKGGSHLNTLTGLSFNPPPLKPEELMCDPSKGLGNFDFEAAKRTVAATEQELNRLEGALEKTCKAVMGESREAIATAAHDNGVSGAAACNTLMPNGDSAGDFLAGAALTAVGGAPAAAPMTSQFSNAAKHGAGTFASFDKATTAADILGDTGTLKGDVARDVAQGAFDYLCSQPQTSSAFPMFSKPSTANLASSGFDYEALGLEGWLDLMEGGVTGTEEWKNIQAAKNALDPVKANHDAVEAAQASSDVADKPLNEWERPDYEAVANGVPYTAGEVAMHSDSLSYAICSFTRSPSLAQLTATTSALDNEPSRQFIDTRPKQGFEFSTPTFS